MNIDVGTFSAFLLILVRVTSFFMTLPIFSYRNIPTMHKIGFAFFLSWIIFYSMEFPSYELDTVYIMLLLKEVMVGLLVGLAAFIILTAIQIAGGFIDFQMGFAIANVIDPQTGAQSPLTGQYLYTFALLLMLTSNGHHLLLDGIFYSYRIVPMDQPWIPLGSEVLMEHFLSAFGSMFIVAFQMSIPVVGCLFLTDVALGIVGRTVPQMNIFVVGLPLKILVSFVILALIIPSYVYLIEILFEKMLVVMRGLMDIMGGV